MLLFISFKRFGVLLSPHDHKKWNDTKFYRFINLTVTII